MEFRWQLCRAKKNLMPSWLIFVFIGLIGGVAAGIFGLGGGLIVVPALVYWAEFSQNLAIGTTFAILLRPIGLARVFRFRPAGLL